MTRTINASCTECGAMFPREEAATGTDHELECPVCGANVIRGIPKQHSALFTSENVQCAACGATFPRGEAETEIKGVLACPECGSTSDLEGWDE